MSKKLIFISHIHEESKLALLLSQIIKTIYLDMLDTFVSSDIDNLSAGDRWIDTITEALNSSVIQLILCSPYSIHRPWINFESGAAWIRRIPVIPICHSGLTKNNLPIPLQLFQSCDINNKNDLTNMFNSFTHILECRHPNIDYENIIQQTNHFSNDYTYYSKIRESVDVLELIIPGIKQNIFNKSIEKFSFIVSDHQKNIISPYIEFLTTNRFIFSTKYGFGLSANGPTSTQEFTINQNFYEEVRQAYSCIYQG